MTKNIAAWISSPWIGFDTETTGISPATDRVVTAALVVRPGGLDTTDPDQINTWLINPGVAIPSTATAVHGISTEYAREHGGPAAQGLEEINQSLATNLRQGWPIVIFNAGYDLPLLAADSNRHNVPNLHQRLNGDVCPIIDPLVLDRALNRYRKGKRTLIDLCQAYGIPVPNNTHQAHVDAQITLLLLQGIVQEFPQLQKMTTEELQIFQRAEHAKWADNFESFLRSKGNDSKISRTWF